MATPEAQPGDVTRFTHILDRVRSGDPRALDDLIDRAAGRVYRIVHYYLRGSYRDAAKGCETEDLSQHVWAKVSEKFRAKPDCVSVNTLQFHAFVTKLIQNAARDVARKVRGPKFQTQHPDRKLFDDDAPPVADPTPHDAVERRIEARALVERLIATLSEGEQLLINASFIEGEPVEAIASDLGISPEAARKRIARALDKLRKAGGPGLWESVAG